MIYTECKPDSALVKTLGIPKRQVIHLGGKPEVCKQLAKRENCNGLVDEDPFSVQPPYLKKLQEKENLSDCGLKILNDNSKNNDLIILCPRLEEWILKATKEAKIDIKQYKLPDEGGQLHKVINLDIRKFDKLITDLTGKSEMVKALQKSVKELEMK
ncbi:MAG: hypothetical protein IBX41_02585 [Methanophagales archaeon]|nr:hypothetical protein [Methanophagales archaeon]